MSVETKFDIGDRVVYEYNHKIKCNRIIGMDISSSKGVQLYFEGGGPCILEEHAELANRCNVDMLARERIGKLLEGARVFYTSESDVDDLCKSPIKRVKINAMAIKEKYCEELRPDHRSDCPCAFCHAIKIPVCDACVALVIAGGNG